LKSTPGYFESLMPRLVFGISHWKVHNIEKPKTIQGEKTIQITV